MVGLVRFSVAEERRRAGGYEMLVELQDIRLRSARGFYAHLPHASPSLISPHPTHISIHALATPYPSEIDPASLCLSPCLDSSTLFTRVLGRRPDWLPHYCFYI